MSGRDARRAAGAVLAVAVGIALGLVVHAITDGSYRAAGLLQDLAGGAVVGLVVWIGLVTLRRSRPRRETGPRQT